MNGEATTMREMVVVAIIWLAGILAPSGIFVAWAGEQVPGPVNIVVQARITISPEGRIEHLAWLEKNEARLRLARAVESRTSSLEFDPGMLDGVPATTETTLKMLLRVTPSSDKGLEVRIVSASTGAATEKMVPPRYPADAMYAGVEAEVLSVIEIDVEGRATVASTSFESSSGGSRLRKQFVRASEDAIAEWRFVPERVGGHAVPGSMRVPIDYCLVGARAWCEARNRARSAEELAAAEGVALQSVVRLKTDLAGFDI